MAPTYLDEILTHHRARAARDTRVWQDRLSETRYEGRSLLGALRSDVNPYVKVIAEVKRHSPSRGWLAPDLDAASCAQIYEGAGAAAISVLTDEAHFKGSRHDFEAVHASSTLPLLRKDFTVSANDVLDTAALGAAGVLLIVAALSDDELTQFVALADQCGIDALVEVHDHVEAQRALSAGARLIGVNQRDLHTFVVNPERAVAVRAALPDDIVTVAESGLRTRHDVIEVAEAGFDAVLVGEAFVRAAEPAATVHSFANVVASVHG